MRIDEQFYAFPYEVPSGCLDVKEGIKVLELGSAPGNKACILQIIEIGQYNRNMNQY